MRQQGSLVYCAIMLWSDSSKSILMFELTMPWEERLEDAFKQKRAKYEEQLSESQVLARGGRVLELCRPVALQGHTWHSESQER